MDLSLTKNTFCPSVPKSPMLISVAPLPDAIHAYINVSLRRAKFSSICREVGIDLRPIAGLVDEGADSSEPSRL
jgi:hypothetical protein